jgi:hypothetical protein
MVLIYRKLNINYFHKQLQEILDEAVKAKLHQDVEPLVIRLFEASVKNYLLESKVVDKQVHFRWTNKEKVDAN